MGLDTQKIKKTEQLKFTSKNNVALLSANATDGIIMWRDLIMNNYVLASAKNIGAYHSVTA